MADENGDVLEQSTPVGDKKGLPIIPIVIGVVLLGVIGAVVWFVVLPMMSPPAEEVEGEAVEELVAEEEPAGEGVYDPENQPGIIVFNEPFLIKLRKNPGVLESETYLQISISMEVDTPEIQATMEEDLVVMNRIQDTINTFFASQYLQNVEVVQWPQLKENLTTEINAQFPVDYHIKRINFRDILIQTGR